MSDRRVVVTFDSVAGTWDLDLQGVPDVEHAFLVRVLRHAADLLEVCGDAETISGGLRVANPLQKQVARDVHLRCSCGTVLVPGDVNCPSCLRTKGAT